MRADPEGLGDWLILNPSEDYPGYWEIEAVYDDYLPQFEDLVGNYRVISPARLNIFMERAEKGDFKVAFTEDPEPLLTHVRHLSDKPSVAINSDLDNTTNGFLPWQVVGFNKLIASDLTAGYAVWDTGTGKTTLIAASILHHMQQDDFDLALVFVKAHNKTDTQRKLKQLGNIDSTVIDNDPEHRAQAYYDVLKRVNCGERVVVISNYEKIRDDKVYDQLVKKRRVLLFWDEMPTKLAHHNTQLYKATKQMLYKSFVSKPWPKSMHHLILSATPLDRDPGDVYWCMNIARPFYLGSPSDFHGRYVRRRNWISGKPEVWGDLDEIEIRMDHMVHRVSEHDPEVAALMPENVPHTTVLDWTHRHRAVYDKLTHKAREIYDEEKRPNALALIQVMQMLCDAPSMVLASADNRARFEAMLCAYGDSANVLPSVSGPTGSSIALQLLEHVSPSELTDNGHSKLEWFKEVLTEKHRDDKVVVHSTWAEYIFPVWEHWLTKWGVSYVIYAGTDKQRQQALDKFRSNWDIQVFLSGDSGSDSIDIPQARAGVQYNLPWGFVIDVQRRGRYRRVDSTHARVHTHYGRMINSVEDRKKAIQDRKRSYHAQIFEGRAVESALAARLTEDDFRYMLFGDES